jgi:hypothetical protein
VPAPHPSASERYQRLRDRGKHHNSALCTTAAVLITRIAACWRAGQHDQLRHLDGRPITDAEGRKACNKITTARRPRPPERCAPGRRSRCAA